jgi:hypothetical protein
MAEAPRDPPDSGPSLGLILTLFVVGGLIAAGVSYLGVSGVLGGGVPGTYHAPSRPAPSLASCAGKDTLGTFEFVLTAGAGGAARFNSSSPGPCIAVVAGSHVTVVLSVLIGANRSVSWVLIDGTGPTTQPPVFPGAGPSDSSRFTGIFPGHNATYSFVAATPGQYRYVSEVADQAAVGMWGGFNVTAAPSALGSSVP